MAPDDAAVVGGDDDDRVVIEAGRLQRADDFPDKTVQFLHLGGILRRPPADAVADMVRIVVMDIEKVRLLLRQAVDDGPGRHDVVLRLLADPAVGIEGQGVEAVFDPVPFRQGDDFRFRMLGAHDGKDRRKHPVFSYIRAGKVRSLGVPARVTVDFGREAVEHRSPVDSARRRKDGALVEGIAAFRHETAHDGDRQGIHVGGTEAVEADDHHAGCLGRGGTGKEAAEGCKEDEDSFHETVVCLQKYGFFFK